VPPTAEPIYKKQNQNPSNNYKKAIKKTSKPPN
jgi:hypothetical protein